MCDLCFVVVIISIFFFFQAEDGIRDAQESRGLGDVYKRQHQRRRHHDLHVNDVFAQVDRDIDEDLDGYQHRHELSLIHI